MTCWRWKWINICGWGMMGMEKIGMSEGWGGCIIIGFVIVGV